MTRLDSLTRLIAGTDFVTFREICIKLLTIKGYDETALSDGWNDGGTDVVVGINPDTKSPLAIQITVDSKIKKKLVADAIKAKDKLKLNRMILLYNKRFDEHEFNAIQTDIVDKHGVIVTKEDSQGIASFFFKNKRSIDVLEIMGIDFEGLLKQYQDNKHFDSRQNAVFSSLFFGELATDFRESIIESTIISVLSSKSDILTEENLINEVILILCFDKLEKNKIKSVLDRLRLKEIVIGKFDNIEVAEEISKKYKTLVALREQEIVDLKIQISASIRLSLPKAVVTDDFLNRLIESIGSYFAASISKAKDQLTHSFDNSDSVSKTLKDRYNKLNLLLNEINFPEGNSRDLFLKEINEKYVTTDFAHQLLAGELIISYANLSLNNFIQALGGSKELISIIDASVAIPILCSYMFKPTSDKFILYSHELFQKLKGLEVKCVLPEDYLEEIATHLIYAYSNYRDIVDLDPDLAASENAFVGHYVGLKNIGEVIEFDSFVESLGSDSRLRAYAPFDFYFVRDNLKYFLKRHFELLPINVKEINSTKTEFRKLAEKELSDAINTLVIDKSPVLVKHDLNVLSYLFENSSKPDTIFTLATWDKVHFKVRSQLSSSYWDVFDPTVFLDAISVCKSSDVLRPLSIPLSVIRTINEETAEKAAKIWDTIVNLDEKISNSALINKAKEFKTYYMGIQNAKLEKTAIKDSWTKWKNQNGVNK
jgi:predicted transcriptional regulator